MRNLGRCKKYVHYHDYIDRFTTDDVYVHVKTFQIVPFNYMRVSLHQLYINKALKIYIFVVLGSLSLFCPLLYMFKIVQNKKLKRNTSVFLVQHNQTHGTRCGLKVVSYQFSSSPKKVNKALRAYAHYNLSVVARAFRSMLGLHKFNLTPKMILIFSPYYPYCPPHWGNIQMSVTASRKDFPTVLYAHESKQRWREKQCRIRR